VPNGEITVASNLTRVFARVNQEVQVVYGTDIERATAVVNQVGQELVDDATWGPRILEAPRVDQVSALGKLGVTLKIVGTVRASEQWAVGGELRKRLLAAFGRVASRFRTLSGSRSEARSQRGNAPAQAAAPIAVRRRRTRRGRAPERAHLELRERGAEKATKGTAGRPAINRLGGAHRRVGVPTAAEDAEEPLAGLGGSGVARRHHPIAQSLEVLDHFLFGEIAPPRSAPRSPL